MRVSNQQFYDKSTTTLMEKQAELLRIQNQIAQGTRLLTPSDDPSASSRIVQIDQAVQYTTQFQRNSDMAIGRLELEETTLIKAGTSLQRIRDLVIQGKTTAAVSDADRKFVAAEVRERLAELAALANTRDSNGDYLFAGFQSQAQPFVPNAAGQYVYNGDQGQRLLQVSPDRRIADGDSGFAVFESIRSGNGTFVADPASANTGTAIIDPGSVMDPTAYQPHDFRIVFTGATTFDVIDDTTSTTVLSAQPFVAGATINFNGIETSIGGVPAAGDTFHVEPSPRQSIFRAVEEIAAALETPLANPQVTTQFEHEMNRALTDLDQGLEKMVEVRTSIGARLKALDTQKEVNDELNYQLANVRSKLHDLDLAAASVRLNENLVALQAAQQAFIRTQGLSLFELLR